jgi:pilus assembly protein Flp/PilA
MLTRIKRSLVEFLGQEDGPTAVEYAVMLALIIAVCIAAVQSLGSATASTFSYVATSVSTTGS